ncbi:MAG: thioredoxin domain-containing protein [Prevotellaceae bacterium]|nr:thioredoxin domain-containing protein [Prevotellaceae bacterium]
MKKLLFSLSCLCSCLVAGAQTEFRHVSFDEAKAAAKAESKLLFIDFYTEWCGPCKRMANEIFPQKPVGDYLNPKFVCVKINAEKGEGVELANKYKITAYPTFIVADATGKEMGKFEGGRDIDGLRTEIERIIDPSKSPDVVRSRYDSGERTPDVVLNYAALVFEEASNIRAKNAYEIAQKKAEKVVQDYFSNLSEADRLKKENLFVYRKYSSTPDTPSARFMTDNIDRFPADMKADIDTIVKDLFQNTMASRLGGHLPFNKADYEAEKAAIKRLRLNADKWYDQPLRFLDEYAKGDLSRFIDFCSSNITKLDKRLQTTMMLGMSDLIQTDDQAVRQKAARFIRSQLADMDARNIMFVAYTLMDLEGDTGH